MRFLIDRSNRRMAFSVLTVLAGVSGLAAVGMPGASSAPAAPEWEVLSPYPDRIVLTWSQDPTTTQSVTWRTDPTVTNPVAQYALASPGPRFEIDAVTMPARSEVVDFRSVPDAGVVAKYHSVTFHDLSPDTLYAYRVGDGERWSEWFHFRTASREPEPFSFIYFGDAQNDILSLWSRAIRSGYTAAPDARFMVHAGDLVNSAHADGEWAEWFRAGGFIHAMVPSVPTPGNHEYRPITPEDEEDEVRRLSVFWTPQFTLPENGAKGLEESSYYMDYQGMRMVVMNSNERLEEQAVWLEGVLAQDPQKWTVVAFHHPVFSSGEGRDNPRLRSLWKPVLDRHGVDLVLQGHDHTYARGRSPAPERNAFTGANARDAEIGTMYVVSVSGAKMYQFKPERWDDYEAKLDRQAENTQLFQVIRVAGDTLQYRAHTVVGETYDSFDLIKSDAGPNRLVDRTPASAATRSLTDSPAYDRR
ncbi:MAG: metallophosphoesterase [Gemmatimonas sp.]|nr:metallophosphoesterase [Gemmatimonas sp.]